MKITIDCRMIDRSGIGTVIQELVPKLLEAPHQFVLLGDPACLERYANGRTEIVPFQEPIYSVREQIRFPRRVLRNTGVLLCPHYNIPLTTFPRVVVIVHDLAHLVLPQFFGERAKRLYAYFFFYVMLRNAVRIITPSEFTRNEILKHLPIAADRLVTIPNGPGRSFIRSVDSSIDRLRRLDVVSPYILAVGNMKPHKNLQVLLEAFCIARQQMGDPKLKLVITGKSTETRETQFRFPGWSRERLEAENVVLTGYVPDEDMPGLYGNASLYVTASLYEGFGLTPLEALRFGTLPLVADAAALSEVVADPDLRFDPKDPKDLASKILMLMNKPELLHQKLLEQRERMRQFSWDSTAKTYMCLLEQVGAETGKELS
jgi:glycosyltransferase involved in cell wall biosynthesis